MGSATKTQCVLIIWSDSDVALDYPPDENAVRGAKSHILGLLVILVSIPIELDLFRSKEFVQGDTKQNWILESDVSLKVCAESCKIWLVGSEEVDITKFAGKETEEGEEKKESLLEPVALSRQSSTQSEAEKVSLERQLSQGVLVKEEKREEGDVSSQVYWDYMVFTTSFSIWINRPVSVIWLEIRWRDDCAGNAVLNAGFHLRV